MTSLRSRVAGLAILPMLTLPLGGCVREIPLVSAHEKGMHVRSKAQTEERIRRLFERTTAVVGGEWETAYVSWQVVGDFADGSPADAFEASSQSWTVHERSPDEIARKVAAEWLLLGLPVKVVDDDTLRPPRKVVSYPADLTGVDEEGFTFRFSVGVGFADFMADSPPYPADE